MADNKPALFPITAFIVSYHYARSASLCVSRGTVYDLFIAAPPPTHKWTRLTSRSAPPEHALCPTCAPTPSTHLHTSQHESKRSVFQLEKNVENILNRENCDGVKENNWDSSNTRAIYHTLKTRIKSDQSTINRDIYKFLLPNID